MKKFDKKTWLKDQEKIQNIFSVREVSRNEKVLFVTRSYEDEMSYVLRGEIWMNDKTKAEVIQEFEQKYLLKDGLGIKDYQFLGKHTNPGIVFFDENDAYLELSDSINGRYFKGTYYVPNFKVVNNNEKVCVFDTYNYYEFLIERYKTLRQFNPSFKDWVDNPKAKMRDKIKMITRMISIMEERK